MLNSCSSARSRIDEGIARPSVLATLRFTAISNFVSLSPLAGVGEFPTAVANVHVALHAHGLCHGCRNWSWNSWCHHSAA
jgi:hypothetical protein